MNDLTISRSDVSAARNFSTNLHKTTMTIDANDLSFRKIQAASEPLMSKLRNGGYIKELNWVCQEFPAHTLELTNLTMSNGRPLQLFFGSVFINMAKSLEGIFSATVNTLIPTVVQKDFGLKLHEFSGFGDAAYGDLMGGSVSHTIIKNIELTGARSTSSILVIGFMISLNRTIPVQGFATSPLGTWNTNRATENVITSADPTPRGASNFWDASSAPNGVPSYLKPSKVMHTVSHIVTTRLWSTPQGGAGVRYIPGTVIPRNFLGFLQYVRAGLSGSQYVFVEEDDQDSPTYEPDNLGAEYRYLPALDKQIHQLIRGVRDGHIKLSTDSKEFVVAAFNFSEINASAPIESYNTTAAIFSYDPIEPGTVSLNFLDTTRRIVGTAPSCIGLYYPLVNAESHNQPYDSATLAHDLIKLSIANLTVSIPMDSADSPDSLSYLTPKPNHREISQYACAFRYPDPLL